MKCNNIQYSACAVVNGEIVAHKFFVTEQAKNNWCNRQYKKVGEAVIVEVYNFETGNLIETWSA